MDKCKKCGVPIDEDTKCSCEDNVCYHCCGCELKCACGCQNKD